jgi:hypothetical protein
MLPDVQSLNGSSTWQATGQQIITAPTLACNWAASDCTGRVRVGITDLIFRQFGPDPLGSYILDLDFLGEGRLKGHLSSLAGPVHIDGQMEKSPGAAIRIVAHARLGTGANDKLRRFLGEIARSDGPDTFLFSR